MILINLGKWWGPKDKQPILAIHGWQDNASTFDRLIPLLPEGTSVLAIDLPGHGFSSWSPPGIPYTMLGAFYLIRRLAKLYEWKKVKLMGHSMGSMVIFLYSAYLPNETSFSIGIDLVKPVSIDVDEYSVALVQQADDLLKMEARTTEPPSYSNVDIMNRWIKGTDYSLDETACKLLMERGIKEVGDGRFIFSKDPRLIKFTSFDSGYTHEHILKLAKRITCPYRLIKADSSSFYQEKRLVMDTVDVIAKSSVDFSFTVLPGKHHLHLTHPERVTEIINPFLEKYNK